MCYWTGKFWNVADVEIDVLGKPYERRVIDLGHDDEGPLIATLVSRRAERPTGRAVLYVHGFVDYFFQTHLADFYVERGWDFHAIDLRRYGRSLLPHQTPELHHRPDRVLHRARHRRRADRRRDAARQRPLDRRPGRVAVGTCPT